jgi:hypothetical protein
MLKTALIDQEKSLKINVIDLFLQPYYLSHLIGVKVMFKKAIYKTIFSLKNVKPQSLFNINCNKLYLIIN